MRIARDHGKFFHEVGKLPMSEIVTYAAHYIHEQNLQKAEAERLEKESES